MLDSLLQFYPAESAVLEISLSNHTYASSSMFQSTRGPPALGGPLNVLFALGVAGGRGGRAASSAGTGGSATVQ